MYGLKTVDLTATWVFIWMEITYYLFCNKQEAFLNVYDYLQKYVGNKEYDSYAYSKCKKGNYMMA